MIPWIPIAVIALLILASLRGDEVRRRSRAYIVKVIHDGTKDET